MHKIIGDTNGFILLGVLFSLDFILSIPEHIPIILDKIIMAIKDNDAVTIFSIVLSTFLKPLELHTNIRVFRNYHKVANVVNVGIKDFYSNKISYFQWG